MNMYDSVIDGAQELPPEQRGQIYAAVLEYLHYGREPEFEMEMAPRALFVAMRPVLDNQRAAVANGRKGGRPRKARETPANCGDVPRDTEPEPPLSEGDAVPETQTEPTLSEKPAFSKSEQEQEQEGEKPSPSGEVKKSAPLSPPTVAEVAAYAAERGWQVDAERFCAYYGSQGWKKANGQPLTSWRLAVANWARGAPGRRRGAPRRAVPDFSAYEAIPEEGTDGA